MTDSPADDTLPGYFIAPDAWGDVYVWRERADDRPVTVLAKQHFRNDPALWDILAAAIRTVDA